MQIDKPTFTKCIALVKDYKERLDRAYTEIERVVGSCENLMERIDGMSAMIELLEVACKDNKFITAFVFDTDWGRHDAKWVDDNGREFPFRTVDNLWEVLNYTKPWELKLVWC